jgi:hypothetical protein
VVSIFNLVTGVALGGALLLVAGGVVHLRDRRAFGTVLAAQRLVPGRLRGAVAIATGPAEVAVGTAMLAGWLAAPALLGWALPAGAACYAAFGAYTTVLRVRRPAAPCGCLGGRAPVTWLVAVRAWLFAVAAAVAAVVPVVPAGEAGRLWPLAVAIVVAGTAWLIPELFAAPAPVGKTQVSLKTPNRR